MKNSEKKRIFGWVDLAFLSSFLFKWTICTISLTFIFSAHTTKLQAQILAHPSIHRLWKTWKRKKLIVKPPGSMCLQLLLLLTWAIGEEAVPARSSPKPPTLPNPWVLPTSFPEWWSSSICIHWHALERAGIPNQKLINGEKIQERSFYLTWNHDNHKVALGIFESDCCQIHVIFKNLDMFQWLYSCSVKIIWSSKTLKPFRPLPPFQKEVCILLTTKRVQMPKMFEFTLEVQTHKLWLASLFG